MRTVVIHVLALVALVFVRAEAVVSVANDQTVEVGRDTTVRFNLDWTMGTASMLDFKFHLKSQPAHGLAWLPSGSSVWQVCYKPDDGFTGTDSLTWNITQNNDTLTSNTATATFHVVATPTGSTVQLTVNSGSGDGDYLPGTLVSIVADAPAAGQDFDYWDRSIAALHIHGGNSPSAFVEIPEGVSSVWVQPVYKASTPGTPVITSALTAAAKQGKSFTYQITATNGPTSYMCLSELPFGLSFDFAIGKFTGKPKVPGHYLLSLRADNAAGEGSIATLTLDVSDSGSSGSGSGSNSLPGGDNDSGSAIPKSGGGGGGCGGGGLSALAMVMAFSLMLRRNRF